MGTIFRAILKTEKPTPAYSICSAGEMRTLGSFLLGVQAVCTVTGQAGMRTSHPLSIMLPESPCLGTISSLRGMGDGEEERERGQLGLPLRRPGALTHVCSGDRMAGAIRGHMI